MLKSLLDRDTSESEEEEDPQDTAGICQTLTDIASGYTVATITGDFFGDSELAGLGVEGLVSLEGGGSLGGANGSGQQLLQEWSLPRYDHADENTDTNDI